MSEEEKEAIEKIKMFEYRYVLKNKDDEAIEAIINLIDKRYVEMNYISKDKIKAKIKELEEKSKNSVNNCYDYGIYFLKELLGEEE